MYHVIPRMRNANLVNKYGDFGTPSISIERFNSFAADFLAPSAGKNIYVREIKLQTLTFVNRAIPVANGTAGVLSTLVANGSETVSTTVAIGSERVKIDFIFHRHIITCICHRTTN